MKIGGGPVGSILARSNMSDRSEKLEPVPTNQDAQESAPRLAAPENPPKAGRLPLFRK